MNQKLAKFKSRQGRDLYTFETLGHDLSDKLFGDKLNNGVFIVDEAQYMFMPYHKGKNLGDAYYTVRDFLTKKRNPSNTWCLAMTATPGNTRSDALGLVQLVATSERFDDKSFNLVGKDLEQKIRGFVSFVDLRGDRSHFAELKKTQVQVRLHPTVTSKYTKLYRQALCKAEKWNPLLCKRYKDPSTMMKEQIIWSRENKKTYYKYLRACSNYIMLRKKRENESPPQQGGTEPVRKSTRARKNPDVYKPIERIQDDYSDEEYTVEEDEGINGFEQSDFYTSDGSGDYQVYVSPKIKELMKNLTNPSLNGKHFIFTNDKVTMGIVARLLMQSGIPRLDPVSKDDSKIGGWKFSYKGVEGSIKTDKKQPCFITLNNIVSKKSHTEHLRYKNVNRDVSGEELNARITACKQQANSQDNINGEHVKYILGTEESFKGVDFDHIKYLHLIDPMTETQDMIQFEGRGARYCSHRHWGAPSKWVVQMFAYNLIKEESDPSWDDVPDRLIADSTVLNNSLKRFEEEWNGMDETLRKASVDYLVFNENIHSRM
jgi:hypothetical protein